MYAVLDGDLIIVQARYHPLSQHLRGPTNRTLPHPAAGSQHPKAVNLLARIEGRRTDYLRFTSDLAVPFTDNAAERDLRGARLREKIFSCLRTLTGAEAFVAIRSYPSTATKCGQHTPTVLRDLHDGHPWMPAITTG